ncbi:MAG: S41 family peptidase [Bacilli bacterium]|nr:S41 family peptidase [Bacilli bacterium]
MKKSKKINTILGKAKFNTIELALIFAMALVFGVLIGEIVFGSGKQPISLTTSTSSELHEINDVYNTILSEYINDVDKEQLKEAAINGMMSSLKDKHSVYFNPTESEQFQDELNGYFVGLGVAVSKEKQDLVTVREVYKNSPAEKAGLKVKDGLLKINGEDVSKASTDEIANKIKGKEGETFTIIVRRDGQEKEIKATTGKVELPSIEHKVLKKDNKRIGYLTISIFATNTDEQLKEELKELEKENLDDLIIDLRYNNGGELDSVLNVASEFLDKKSPIIQIKTKNKTDIRYSKGNNNKKYNIAVLINKSSASGAEVLAAALNEQLNAPLIGTITYGKGTVQKTKQLADGTIIKYTIETWQTSKGKSIDGTGIQPTIGVKQSDKYYETMKEEDDAQLQKAIDTLLK